ncbi:MAG TPA: hypothetical protein VMF58_14130 [Rhizomicrobium sp.]|nr:hypothetical protein [Rhizomicrobium sp.]
MLAGLMAAALGSVIVMPVHSPQTPGANSAVYVTGVTLGDVDPNNVVPTANGVPNAGTSNWDIALPVAGLTAGTDYKLTFTFEDVGYTGACNVDVRMTQVQEGKKVLLRDVGGYAGQCSPNIYMVSTDFGAMPDSPGPVTLTVTAHYGKAKTSTKVKMLIQ